MAGFGQRAIWALEAGAYEAFLRGFGLLPLNTASNLGAAILRTLGPLTKTHKVALKNLEIAFPDRTPEWRETTARQHWSNIGRTFAEYPHLHKITAYQGDNITVKGVEHLDAVTRSGRGAVLISGHFANWEVMAMAIVQSGLDCAITYRAANNPWFDEQVKRVRRGYGVGTLTPKAGMKGARELMAILEEGRAIALMNDQKFNEGIPVPFFGREAMTAPGPTRLAMRAGVPLIPMSVKRIGDAPKFEVTVHEPFDLPEGKPTTEKVEAVVTRINRFVEDRIKESPADWFWVHRRFEKPVYREE